MPSNPIRLVIAAMAALLLGGPLGAAVVLTAVITPAVAEQQRPACPSTLALSGDWRPPFEQAYTRTSGFGMRLHPIKHVWKLHSGTDLVSLPGPGPVVAASSGTITAAGYRGGYGNAVDIDHGNGVTSRYAHLARIHPGIAPGTPVAVGQVLGLEGSTGSSTGNHLHFEVIKDTVPVDPMPFMAEHGAPLDGRAVAPNANGDTVAPADVQGGIGFDLPEAGTTRLASLSTPAAPIPPRVKALYVAAAHRYQLPWTLLAGIGMEETGHGATHATSPAGAQGLMQFMPGTFAIYGVDGDHDGRASITSDADSIYSAANYLTRSGAATGPAGVASCPVRVQPRRLVRQRRPALRPRLRRRPHRHHGLHQLRSPNVAAKPTPTGIRGQRHRQGRNTMQQDRRTTPYPRTWEIPLTAAMVIGLVPVLAAHLARAAANGLSGTGWALPPQAELFTSLPALLGGDSRAGLTPAPPAAPALLYTCLAVTQLLAIALLVWAARLAWRAWGPGRVRGMASRAQAQAMLGPSRLRRVAPVVRPDRYGNRRHR